MHCRICHPRLNRKGNKNITVGQALLCIRIADDKKNLNLPSSGISKHARAARNSRIMHDLIWCYMVLLKYDIEKFYGSFLSSGPLIKGTLHPFFIKIFYAKSQASLSYICIKRWQRVDKNRKDLRESDNKIEMVLASHGSHKKLNYTK